MRQLALCLPYYKNQSMLREQLTRIKALPDAIKNRIEVLVVDDGSPDGEAQGMDIGCPLKIFRIGVDIRWNQDAARNIGAFEAKAGWLLLTDIDHLIPEGTWRFILDKKLEKRRVYKFARVTAEKLAGIGGNVLDSFTPYKPHPNSWLISRGVYWEIGGYDERFAGFYGTDADFRDRVLAHLKPQEIIDLPCALIRVPRETIPDASTTNYSRKEVGVDDVGIRRIKIERDLKPNWRPLNLSFAYKKIWDTF